jgi:hypothetical protein
MHFIEHLVDVFKKIIVKEQFKQRMLKFFDPVTQELYRFHPATIQNTTRMKLMVNHVTGYSSNMGRRTSRNQTGRHSAGASSSKNPLEKLSQPGTDSN